MAQRKAVYSRGRENKRICPLCDICLEIIESCEDRNGMYLANGGIVAYSLQFLIIDLRRNKIIPYSK